LWPKSRKWPKSDFLTSLGTSISKSTFLTSFWQFNFTLTSLSTLYFQIDLPGLIEQLDRGKLELALTLQEAAFSWPIWESSIFVPKSRNFGDFLIPRRAAYFQLLVKIPTTKKSQKCVC
jgi:hypothetical protein